MKMKRFLCGLAALAELTMPAFSMDTTTEKSLPPDATSPRVVTFGDSTTAQRGTVENYTTQLQQKMPGVTFINKGVGGNTTTLAARRFQADVINSHPDVVVIQFGINDSAVDLWKTPPATEPRVSLETYDAHLRAFVTELRAQGAQVILMTPNQMRWSAPILEKYGFPPYRPDDVLGLTHILANYAAQMRKVAAEMNVPLVDIYALYDEPERKSGLCRDLLLDGMHPSRAGHVLVVENLEPVLREVLAKPKTVSR